MNVTIQQSLKGIILCDVLCLSHTAVWYVSLFKYAACMNQTVFTGLMLGAN